MCCFPPFQVIPQLIARIDTPRHLVSSLIQQHLKDIGKEHPQALIYPLTVASKSNTAARHNAANRVLKSMREHSPLLVQQAILVRKCSKCYIYIAFCLYFHFSFPFYLYLYFYN